MQTFIKSAPLKSLEAELDGLHRLAKCLEKHHIDELSTPEVLVLGQDSMSLQYLKQVSPSEAQMVQLGKGLAKLHLVNQNGFGYTENNFIGLSPQRNVMSKNWGEFFVEYRLSPQIQWLKDETIRRRFSEILDGVNSNLCAWLNANCNGPSLLHGDLWSGNVIFTETNVYLIDPAVYFGDSEADIAMTEMFGGFAPSFYGSYQELKPLTHAYPIKREIYNLYHYLNHLNLFGNAYLPNCEKGFQVLQEL